MKQKNKDSIFSFSGKRFRNGSYSATIIVFVVAIVVVLNLIVAKLPAEYMQLDVSGNNMFSMSEESKELLDRVEEEIKIYYLLGKAEQENYPQVESLLDKYEAYSENIKVLTRDKELYPSFGNQYEATGDTFLVVESKKRFKTINYDDLYTISNMEEYYYQYAEPKYAFTGENAIANAVSYVITDKLPKIYTLEGDGELQLADSVSELIENSNVSLDQVNLSTADAVPEDADCLMIVSPEKDFSKEVADKVIKYLKAGGNAMIFTDYLGKDNQMPNLKSVLEEYGVTVDQGLVFEGDNGHTYQNMPTYIFPTIKSHDITLDMVSKNINIFMPSVQSIREMENKRETLKVESLLATSGQSYVKENPEESENYEKEKEDLAGPCNVGVAIKDYKTAPDDESGEEPEVVSKLVVFGCSAPIDESIHTSVAPYNSVLLVNALGWMCDTQDSIYIASKALTEESLTIPDAKVNLWKNIYAIVLPLGVAAAGLVVTALRRRK